MRIQIMLRWKNHCDGLLDSIEEHFCFFFFFFLVFFLLNLLEANWGQQNPIHSGESSTDAFNHLIISLSSEKNEPSQIGELKGKWHTFVLRIFTNIIAHHFIITWIHAESKASLGWAPRMPIWLLFATRLILFGPNADFKLTLNSMLRLFIRDWLRCAWRNTKRVWPTTVATNWEIGLAVALPVCAGATIAARQ